MCRVYRVRYWVAIFNVRNLPLSNGVYHLVVKRYLILGVLSLVAFLVFSIPTPGNFSVSFFDVGQGDALFIQSSTGVQVLVDGGATRAVLRELGDHMPFFDRTIDVIIATHPDQDHIGGLSDVLRRYDTKLFIESGVESDTSAFLALKKILEEKNVTQVRAIRGTRIMLGGGAYADILFPDRDVSMIESNTASIVMRVVYGEHEFLLTGDSPRSIERYLVSLDGSNLKSDVLKVGHHGSKTSSDESFVLNVAPQYAVIQAGKDNRYGHPHKETLDTLQSFGIRTFNSGEDGTVTFRSNGKTLNISKH